MNNKIMINDKEYEVVAYVTIDIGNFIVYTDGKTFSNGQVVLYVNRLSSYDGEVVFDEVENDELVQVINSLKERLV